MPHRTTRPSCGRCSPRCRPHDMRHPGTRSAPSALAPRSTARPFLRLRYDHRILIPRPSCYPRRPLLLRRLCAGGPGRRDEPGRCRPPGRGGRAGRQGRARAAVPVPVGDTGTATARGAPSAPGRLRGVVAGGGRRQRRGTRRARRAPKASAGQHAEDPVRAHRAAGAPRGPQTHRRGRGVGGHRRRQQPGRHQGRPHLPRGGPVAGCLPQLGQRRRACPGRPQRRLAGHRRADAGQGPVPGRPGHPCRLARRVRRARPGVVRVRPRGVRTGRAAQRGVRRVLRHGHRTVPRGRLVLRHPEHQPPAHRRRHRALSGTHRRQERLHQQRGQHPDRRREARWAHPRRDGAASAVRQRLRRLRGGALPSRLGFPCRRARRGRGLAAAAAPGGWASGRPRVTARP